MWNDFDAHGQPVGYGNPNYMQYGGTPESSGYQYGSLTMESSVVIIRNGTRVTVASDTQVTFEPMARYQNVEQVFQVNQETYVGGYGAYPNVQVHKRSFDQRTIYDQSQDNGVFWQTNSQAMCESRNVYCNCNTPYGVYAEEPYLDSVHSRGPEVNYAVPTSSTAQQTYLPAPVFYPAGVPDPQMYGVPLQSHLPEHRPEHLHGVHYPGYEYPGGPQEVHEFYPEEGYTQSPI
ncbi:hypothetical protein KR018_006096 [Drosophila ironensis]|nr:hypothetical protein KR018_006096 [Drosophila ironensis]